MLLDSHVKNLALIERVEISFEEGLDILMRETGAGKSIIIGSVNMTLDGKVSKNIIRRGVKYAYAEFIFRVTGPEKIVLLQAMDVELPEDGILIISKKVVPPRSMSKINDITVTAAKLEEITSLLIDIHGQHEHQSLLYRPEHLQILNAYAKSWAGPIRNTIAQTYRNYQELQKRIKPLSMDRESRLWETDFCRFEVEELENADLREGEEEELTVFYRKFQHGQRIIERLSAADRTLSSESTSVALKKVDRMAEFNEALDPIRDQLYDADSITRSITYDVSSYIDSFSFDEEEYERIGERLDVIHGPQAKYGDDTSSIMVQLEKKGERLEELEDYNVMLAELEPELTETEQMLEAQSQELSTVWQEVANVLVNRVQQGPGDLDFIDVRFDMKLEKSGHYTSDGYNETKSLISTNSGEPVRPLDMVASRGELPRIMLAIRAALADMDEISTLIFDEIDTGISGRVAQRVSGRLSYIGKSHQVICIIHPPQIVVMADAHYEIVKSAVNERTTTTIRQLDCEQMIQGLARLLGDTEITGTVCDNTRRMKELVKRQKGKTINDEYEQWG